MDPTFSSVPAFTVIGLPYRGDCKKAEMQALWHRYAQEISAVPATRQVAYGLMDNFDPATLQLDYVAGVPVDPHTAAPAGMARWEVPAAEYAVFLCTLTTIKDTFQAIYKQWLPASAYQRAKGPEFELYDEEFCNTKDLAGVIRIHIPVTKKCQ